MVNLFSQDKPLDMPGVWLWGLRWTCTDRVLLLMTISSSLVSETVSYPGLLNLVLLPWGYSRVRLIVLL